MYSKPSLSKFNFNYDSPYRSHTSRNNSISNKLELIKKKSKILIVDDNSFILEATKVIIKKVLKEAECEMEIISGSDGYDIIHHVIQDQSKGNEIKCIFTDENMEYINGSEAIKILRNLEKKKKLNSSILFLSQPMKIQNI